MGGHGIAGKVLDPFGVSVSSDGSFVFWGSLLFPICTQESEFQYPLMDRLYFGGCRLLIQSKEAFSVSVSSDGSFVFWGDDWGG